MKSQQVKVGNSSSTWLKILVAILLVLGIFFRFSNLDRKVHWSDETSTSLQVSGYTVADFDRQIPNGRIVGIEDIQKFQRINTEKGLVDTVGD